MGAFTKLLPLIQKIFLETLGLKNLEIIKTKASSTGEEKKEIILFQHLIKLIRDKITDIIVKQILLKRKLAKNKHCKHHAHHEKQS